MNPLARKLRPEGLIWFEPVAHRDRRGSFREIFQLRRYLEAGILETAWVQDNMAVSAKGVVRGLHFQKRRPQAKLIYVPRGAVFDVAVDLRPGSPTWGRAWSGLITEADGGQLYVPRGFAHGYQALEDDTVVIYKCSDYYQPDDEGGLAFDDPRLALRWPLAPAVLSPKDRAWPDLAHLAEEMGIEL